MDRTTSRRLFNEFRSEIDLNSPDGLMRSGDVDRYIENALKPLFEEGKAFKRVSINRRTGIRATRYSYQGGKNIQDSINAVLADMREALGYDVDPVTGNVKGTNAPPPMVIKGQGRHYHNLTKERILDPRTAASIRAQAFRAGGSSTTDKATGYTTTLIPGSSGEVDAMRRLVSDTDKKYLAGLLPSSALADGASPATIDERAKAQVARQANIQDAKRDAIADYIRLNPKSQLAIDEMAKLQKVTDRETKARLLAAERTPRTPEFKAAAERRLDRRAANDEAITEWAKKNRRNPVAKAILKNRRNRTAGGRILNKALSAARFGVMGALLTVITTAVGAMVRFLGLLPNIASDTRKIVTKGTQFNITENLMKQYRALGKSMGMDNNGELFSEAQSTIHAKLGDMIHGDLNASISAMAAVSALAGNSSIDAMVEYYRGITNNPDAVMRSVTNDVMKASFMGRAIGKDNLTANEAFTSNVRAAEVDFGMGRLLSHMFEYWQKIPQREEIRRKVVNENADFITLMWEYMGKPLSDRDVSGGVAAERAEEVAKSFEKLKALFESIRDGILLKILALMEPISNYLRMLLIHALEFLNKRGPLEGQLTSTILHLYDENIKTNVENSATVENQMKLTQIQVETLRDRYDMNDPDKRKKALEQINRGFAPTGMSWNDAVAWGAIESLYAQQKKNMDTLTSEAGMRGEVLVSDVSPTAQGNLVMGYMSRAGSRRAQNIEDLLSKYDLGDINVGSLKTLQNTLIDEVNRLGAEYIGHDRAIQEALPPEGESFWLSFLNVFKRLPTLIPATAASVSIGGVERSLEEVENDILAIEALKSELPDSVIDDSVLFLRNMRRETSNNAMKFSENTAVLAQMHDIIGREIGTSYIQDIKSGTATLRVLFDTEKREYTIHVKDSRGNPIGSVKDIYVPGISNAVTVDSLLNIQAGLEASCPTPLGSED